MRSRPPQPSSRSSPLSMRRQALAPPSALLCVSLSLFAQACVPATPLPYSPHSLPDTLYPNCFLFLPPSLPPSLPPPKNPALPISPSHPLTHQILSLVRGPHTHPHVCHDAQGLYAARRLAHSACVAEGGREGRCDSRMLAPPPCIAFRRSLTSLSGVC